MISIDHQSTQALEHLVCNERQKGPGLIQPGEEMVSGAPQSNLSVPTRKLLNKMEPSSFYQWCSVEG